MDLLHRGLLDVPAAAPRLEQHQRLAVQRSDVEVVGESLVHVGHGARIGRVELLAHVGVVLGRIPDRHRLDQRALDLVGVLTGQLLRLHDVLVRTRRVVRAHPAVQVRSPGPRFTPETHRAVGVFPLRLAEGSGRAQRGKRVHHLDALVEELLRSRRLRRNGPRQRAERLGIVRSLFVEPGRVLHILRGGWFGGNGCKRRDDRGRKDGAAKPAAGRFHGQAVR